MLYWAIVYMVLGMIAGVFGFGGIKGSAAGLSQLFFFIFITASIYSLAAYLLKNGLFEIRNKNTFEGDHNDW